MSVQIAALDPDGVASLLLHYAVNGGEWQKALMAIPEGRDTWVGLIPPQKEGARVQFYVEASDSLGQFSLFPVGGPTSRALYPVETFASSPLSVHRMRVITTASFWNSEVRTT